MQEEVAILGDSQLAWWKQHSVSPFSLHTHCSLYGDMYHYVVAVCGSDVLCYCDGYNGEFAYAKREAGSETMEIRECLGNLRDAITYMTQLDENDAA